MSHDEVRMRLLWEAGNLKTIEIAEALGTTLDGVRGTARRRGWIRGPIPRGKTRPAKSPSNLEVESPVSLSTSPEGTPRRSGKQKKAKVAPTPEPPKPPPEREWSTIFSRLAEEHAKMDRVLAETRHVGRLQGL